MENALDEQKLALQVLLLDQKKEFRKFLVAFIRDMRSDDSRQKILEYLKMGRPDLVIKYVTDKSNDFLAAILAAFISGANFETKNLLGISTKFDFTYSFDMANRFAVERLKQVQEQFVADFNKSTLHLFDNFFLNYEYQRSPEFIADMIQQNFGLTSRSFIAVENYRKSLEDLSRTSLDRELRNTSFDEVVLAAIAAHRPLTAKQIDRMVNAYRLNSIRSRIEQMSETSSGTFVEAGRESSAEQFDKLLHRFGFETVKEWRSRRDGKVRYTHTHNSLDGQVVREKEQFRSISGARLFYPRDSRAPMRETVNCRCINLRYIRPIKT